MQPNEQLVEDISDSEEPTPVNGESHSQHRSGSEEPDTSGSAKGLDEGEERMDTSEVPETSVR